MFTPSITNLTATTVSNAVIDTVISHKLTATVQRDELLVADLQKILREIPAQYQITSIVVTSNPIVNNKTAITVTITCNENKVLKNDNTVLTHRDPILDNIIPCTDSEPSVPTGYRREEGMTVAERSTIV